MNVIDVIGLEKSYGPRKILNGVTFAVGEEEKVGLIGVNGSGKSTLLRILGRLEDSDGGVIASKRGSTAGYLSQDPVLDPDATVGEEVERGLVEIRRATSEYASIAERLSTNPADGERLLARQGELSAWIEHHGGWNADYRTIEIMGRLGLPDRNQKIRELSGGTRRRVALARLLLEAPDLLLLDEPTNHLDADTTEWLQEHLRAYSGAVILITHDRYFLDRVVTRMLELEMGSINSCSGGYSNFLEMKATRLEHEARAASRLLNLLRIETAWMQRGAKARTTKQKARIDRFQSLQQQASSAVHRKETKLDFSTDADLGGTILELLDASKGYGDRKLVDRLTFRMKRGDRVGVIGPNGCGKTTLLRMIMGEEQPEGGDVVIGKKTRIAYFDQNRQVLDPDSTIYDFLGEGDYVQVRGEKRHKIGYLEEFLFPPSDRMRKIETLSGGEKSRLILARLMLQDANLLVLDEPTNDLDIPTLQLLDSALADFPGCVLVVTHDRFFLDKVATGILSFEGDGRVIFYEGNYSLYRELKAQSAEAVKLAATKKNDRAKSTVAKPKAGLSYAERLELERLETQIGELEEQKAGIEAALADPDAYASVPGGVQELSMRFGKVEEDLATHYARWEELELKKESACRE